MEEEDLTLGAEVYGGGVFGVEYFDVERVTVDGDTFGDVVLLGSEVVIVSA